MDRFRVLATQKPEKDCPMTSHDQTRDPRTGRPVLPQDAEKEKQAKQTIPQGRTGRDEERAVVAQAAADLDTEQERQAGNAPEAKGQRPEALAQFAESSRTDTRGEAQPKPISADEHTEPMPTSNRDKHDVATRLLNEGAEGEQPDPKEEGVDRLPDRIRDSR